MDSQQPSNPKIIPMDSFPDKVLHKIFINCYTVDLYPLTLTCKKFNKIISESPQLLGYFLVRFTESKINRDWVGTRDYSNIYVDGAFAENFIPIFQIIGCFVTNFACNINQMKLSVLKKVLMTLKNVKVIKVGDLKQDEMEYSEKDFDEPLPEYDLDYLEYLGDSKLFGLFKKCQAVKLCIESQNGKCTEDENFREMIKNQINLVDLHLGGDFWKDSTLLDKPLDRVKFRLIRLDLWFFQTYKHKNFQTFLNPHKNTLEYLSIKWHGEMLKHFEQFKKLREVKMLACNIEGFVLKTVKDLWVDNVSENIEKCFPNIDTLWIKEHIDDWDSLKEMKNLELLIIEKCVIPALEIPQINKIVLIKTGFIDGKPFKFEDSKIDQITLEKSSPRWLPSFLELKDTNLYRLELKGVKIDWKLKWALEGFKNKIKFLELEKVQEIEEYGNESDDDTADIVSDEESEDSENSSLESDEEQSDEEDDENDEEQSEEESEESDLEISKEEDISKKIHKTGSDKSLTILEESSDTQIKPKVLEYNPQTMSELAEDLTKVEIINNDIFKTIQLINQAYLKDNGSDSEESVTSIGRKRKLGFMDIGIPLYKWNYGEKSQEPECKKGRGEIGYEKSSKFEEVCIDTISKSCSDVLSTNQPQISFQKQNEEVLPSNQDPSEFSDYSKEPYYKVKQLNFDLKKFKNVPKQDLKNFEDFPEEILIKIFKYLSFKERLLVSQTCRRFFEITSNTQFICKFLLNLKEEQIIDGLRPYQKVSVIQSTDFYIPLFNKIGENVQSLKLKENKLKASTSVEIIKKCPNLKHLKIEGWHEEIDDHEELDINLESFKFCGKMEFLSVFKKIQTKSFKFYIDSDMAAGPFPFDGELTAIVEFLLNQTDLKDLYFEGVYEAPKFSLDPRLLEVKFRLEKFSAFNTLFRFPSAIVDFLRLHKESLKVILLERGTKEFLKYVQDFPNLKQVELMYVKNVTGIKMKHVEDLNLDFSCGRILESFPNIKKLKLEREFTVLKELHYCKKLEEIEISFDVRNGFVRFNLPKIVKKFTISMINIYQSGPFRMPGHQLEELTVYDIRKVDWIARLLHHATKKIKINLEKIEVSLKLQKAFETFKHKIIEINYKNCTFDENHKNIDVELSDGVDTDSEYENYESDSDEEVGFEPINLDYNDYDPEVQDLAADILRYIVNNQGHEADVDVEGEEEDSDDSRIYF